ncbi:MAG: STN domain-containing protein [Planctomycetes bacterium]|nr:STN domain-containing protein [Planctomycetota bacterium]
MPAAPSAHGSAPALSLHGLRLLARDEATSRGWSPAPKLRTPREIASETIWKKWAETSISVNCTEQPLAEFLEGLRKAYGLETRIDPELDQDAHTVTFRVEDLAADQAVDLVLKMADLTWVVDANGTLWITTKDRVGELVPDSVSPIPASVSFTARMIRVEDTPPDAPRMAQRRATWMKDRTVSVTLANLPLREAIEKLAAAGGLKLYGWSDAAEEILSRAPIASLVGDNLPLDASLEQLLAPAGLALEFWASEGGGISTVEEVKHWEEFEVDAAKASVEMAKDKAALAARRVRIEGKVLTVRDVAAQLEAQLGEKVRVMPALEFCEATWEADGMEQAAGEVLDILAKDAPLVWGWLPEMDESDPKEGPYLIWLVDRQ